MGIFNWFTGKTKKPEEVLVKSEGISNVIDSHEIMQKLIKRNAKGQFIKGIPNPYINRDAAGKFKSKEPKCPDCKKKIGGCEPKEGECTCKYNRNVQQFFKTN